jgi:glycosyltransferase involved in cell wall biosynthesis
MLRAGFVAPCCGVGGGDGMMCALMRNTKSIEWTGVAVRDPVTEQQWPFCDLPIGSQIHQQLNQYADIEHIRYYNTWLQAQKEVARYADVLITWAMPGIGEIAQHFNGPIVEFIQNEDQHAKQTVKINDPFVTHRVSCSRAALELFPEHHRPHARVFYNAVDPNRVTPRYGRDKTRRLWNVKPDQKIALFMGRFVPEKNPEALIQGLPDDWIALFVGHGSEENTQRLKEAAGRYKPGRCMFLPSQPQVGDILAASDVFVLPSDFEGIPLSMIEAWLAGVPVVVSQFGVVQEIDEQFGDMFVVIPRRPDSETVTKAILMADSEEFAKVANKARSVAWEYFTISRIAAQWEEFLHQIVDDYRFKKRHMKVEIVQGVRSFEVAQ